jgi:uncharacterized MAPEG superfamily protein
LERLTRAHLNCIENIGIFASVVIAGSLLGASSPLFSRLAVMTLIARLGQTTVHVLSNVSLFVFLRANFFLAQYVIWVLMIKEIVDVTRVKLF